MQEEWPEYIDVAADVSTPPPRADLAEQLNRLSLAAALEHLSRRRDQVRHFRRLAAIFGALALIEGGILLGLLFNYLSG